MLYLAIPLETPWDGPAGNLLPDAPICRDDYTQTCRAGMGCRVEPEYKPAQALARLNDSLRGEYTARNSAHRRVWTFPKIGVWLAEDAVYDKLVGVTLGRLGAPVETTRRHIQVVLDLDYLSGPRFVSAWRRPNWWLDTDWKIVKTS